MLNNVVEPEGPQMTIWRRVACWINKAFSSTTAEAYDLAHFNTILSSAVRFSKVLRDTNPFISWHLARSSCPSDFCTRTDFDPRVKMRPNSMICVTPKLKWPFKKIRSSGFVPPLRRVPVHDCMRFLFPSTCCMLRPLLRLLIRGEECRS